MRAGYHLDYVDTITTPGADRALAEGSQYIVEQIRASAELSVARHGSTVLAIVGHHGCAATPVSKEHHWEQVRQALQVVRFWNLPVTVVGLWVDQNWEVEVVPA